MPLDVVEQYISNLIPYQFPAFYRTEGPRFVAFVKAYFEYLEQSNNTLYYARNLYNIHDIDETLDQFIVHFKNKYLNHLPLTSDTDIRNLVKHCLDLYRSKGTPRGVNLLFQLVFGQEIKLYYPGEDLFRLSDGTWIIPMYLEVPISDYNKTFVGKQILGLSSGAKAFVERLVRRSAGPKLIDVFYISAINGHFRTGETIVLFDGTSIVSKCPPIIGSLTSLDVGLSGSGQGFSVGDIVDVVGGRGIGGKARVTSVSDIVGIITFTFIDGGFGYSTNSVILISEEVLQIANVQLHNSTPRGYWQLFETITQPVATINYVGADGSFTNNTPLFTYFANGSQKGEGTIINITTINSTAGAVKFVVASGNMQSTNIHSTSNVVNANVALTNGYFDQTASGNVMGISSNITLNAIDSPGNFALGETVVQYDYAHNIGASGVVTSSSLQGSNVVVLLINCHGIFFTGNQVVGLSSLNTGNLNTIDMALGLIDVSNTFYTANLNYIVGPISNSTATVVTIAAGSGASFQINTNTMNYVETVNVNSDLLRDYFNTALNAANYGFPAHSGNSANLFVFQSWLTENVGTIELLTNINPGQDYNYAPFVRVYDRLSAGVGAQDISILISNTVGAFSLNEVVEQSATGAKGLILSANSSVLTLRRLSTLANFVKTSNSTTFLVGDDTGTSANALIVNFISNSEAVGLNADIDAGVQTGVGAISGLDVSDSGFGYEDEQFVLFVKTNNQSVGSGKIHLGGAGHGTGYYLDKGGFLSDTKKLYDGIYWQNFSYEIRSTLSLEQYKDIMLQVMHVAGCAMFGKYNHIVLANSELGIEKAIINIM